MARIDKFDPIANGFRVDVAADFLDANLGKCLAVGLDSTGKAVIGAGVHGLVGVIAINQKPGRVGPLREVQRIDVMTHGEITDFGPSTAGKVPGVDFGVAGTAYYALADGTITATWATGAVYVGHTIEPDRLHVNFNATSVVAAAL